MEDVIESLIPANSWKIIKLQSEWITLTNWRGNLDRNEHFRGFGPSCEMDVSVQVPLQGSYWTSALDLRPLETFGHPPLVPLKKKVQHSTGVWASPCAKTRGKSVQGDPSIHQKDSNILCQTSPGYGFTCKLSVSRTKRPHRNGSFLVILENLNIVARWSGQVLEKLLSDIPNSISKHCDVWRKTVV